MKSILHFVSTLFLMGILFQSSCKPEKRKVIDYSGSYTFIRTGFTYTVKSYKHFGTDSFSYTKSSLTSTNPDKFSDLSIISNKSDKAYSICLDNRGNCNDSSFQSALIFQSDSVDFGTNFHIYDKLLSVYKMKGKVTPTGFAGEYIEFYFRNWNSPVFPPDQVFIGTFELIKK
jgi:hypothetical protein